MDRDLKSENLQMIERVVARMSQYDFVIKGWAVTIMTGLAAISFAQKNGSLLLLDIIPIVAFWLLGAYYSNIERAFKELFNAVSVADSVPVLSMETKQYRRFSSYASSIFAVHQWLFYLALLVVSFVASRFA